jgi:hypothetical protein
MLAATRKRSAPGLTETLKIALDLQTEQLESASGLERAN